MTMKLAIMADDFTGANDIGVSFIKYGLNVVTLIENTKVNCDVKIISSESRNEEKDIAYSKVKKLFCELKESGFDKFYKKIDSTLRGNIKEEIDAILEETDEIIAVVVGFPKMQREIINGRHYLENKPLLDSEFANDPAKPVIEDDLNKILSNSELITLEEIRGDLQKRLGKIKSRLLIFDSETEDDLKEIANKLVKLNLDNIIVGSAGIMQYLPEEWGIKKDKILVVSGSCSNKNIEQLENFIKKYGLDLDIFNLDVFGRNEKILKKIGKSEKNILIRTLAKREEMNIILKKSEENGIEQKKATKLISDYVGDITTKVIKMKNIRKMILSGGEITYKIMERLNLKGLKIEEEIETGIPRTSSLDLEYSIITKPGGFGGNEIYIKAYENLQKR